MEMSFTDHLEVMKVLEDLVITTYRTVADQCGEQLSALEIQDFNIPEAGFPRLPYPEAIEIAKRATGEDIQYGDDIGTVSEKAIGEEIGVHYFITDWPTAIKPYYAMPYEDDPSVSKRSTSCTLEWSFRAVLSVSTSMTSSSTRYAQRDYLQTVSNFT
jgi:aspartyl-tRNA synthetase